jgi:haloalkane dehalogenase
MRIAFTPDASLYPFTSRWFDSALGQLHYIDEGVGTPILFLHGNPTWSFTYRVIVEQLRDQFRCIAVDYLGFGLSERPDSCRYTVEEHARTVGELVDHLGLDGFITVGHDWGGPISLAIDVERAERVQGVVLANTWFWPDENPFMKLFGKAMSSSRLQRSILEENIYVERLLPSGIARTLMPPEMDHYRKVLPSPDTRKAVAEMPKQILAARPLLDRLAREVPRALGPKPALLVWGMKDPAGSLHSPLVSLVNKTRHTLPRIEATFPDHVAVRLPNAKHYLQEDAPAEIVKAIADRFA